MNIYLTLAWLWRLQMCLLFNYEHLLDPGLWRLQMGLLFNYEHLLDTRHDCDVYKCVCCLTMNIYLIPGMWRLQMCLLFNYEHLLDPGMTVTFTNVFVV